MDKNDWLKIIISAGLLLPAWPIIGIKGSIDNPYIPLSVRKILKNFHPVSYEDWDKGSIQYPTPLVSLVTNYFIELPPFELEKSLKKCIFTGDWEEKLQVGLPSFYYYC